MYKLIVVLGLGLLLAGCKDTSDTDTMPPASTNQTNTVTQP
jgi:hypothetical protein